MGALSTRDRILWSPTPPTRERLTSSRNCVRTSKSSTELPLPRGSGEFRLHQAVFHQADVMHGERKQER